MLVFNGRCSIESTADGFKLRRVRKMYNVRPFVSGQVEQQLGRILSLAHLEMLADSSRTYSGMDAARAKSSLIVRISPAT